MVHFAHDCFEKQVKPQNTSIITIVAFYED